MRAFWGPKFWPGWALAGLGWLLAQLPPGAQRNLARPLGRVAGRLSNRRDTVRDNLARCFPDLSAPERQTLAQRHWEDLGIGLTEALTSWWGPRGRWAGKARVEGLEHVRQCLDRSQGVILLGGHFTPLEAINALLEPLLPVHITYRNVGISLFDELMNRGRTRFAASLIHKREIAKLLRGLKAGQAIWLTFDQAHLESNSVVVPFLGVPAATTTSPVRIAQSTGAAIIPLLPARLGDGYLIRFLPAFAPTGNVAADMEHLNNLLGEHIRAFPEQYFWVHRRFKEAAQQKA